MHLFKFGRKYVLVPNPKLMQWSFLTEKKKKEIIIQTLLLDFLFNSETSAEGVLCLEITSMVY